MSKRSNPFWKNIAGGFIKVPKAMFKEEKYRNISPLAKLLYGFLLDRISLSDSNGDRWKNEKGDVFVVFTIKEISERLDCGREKASKLLCELVDVGLIRRTQSGRSRAYRIVVCPVVSTLKNADNQLQNSDTTNAGKSDPNNTDRNNTELNNTYENTALLRSQYQSAIRMQIEYDVLLERIPQRHIDCIIDVIVDTLCSTKKEIRVSGQVLSAEAVRKRILEVDEMDIDYVYDRLQYEKKDIQYINGFILARLLDSDAIRTVYYDHRVSYDSRRMKN